MDESAIYSAIPQCYNPGIFIICQLMATNSFDAPTGLPIGHPDVMHHTDGWACEKGCPLPITYEGPKPTIVEEQYIQNPNTVQPYEAVGEIDSQQPDLVAARGMFNPVQPISTYEKERLAKLLNSQEEQ